MPKREIYTIVMTSANADLGHFQNPTPNGSYSSFEKAQERFEKLIAKEKQNLNSRYDTEDHTDTVWEMYENGYAAACFVRIEIITSEIQDWSKFNVEVEKDMCKQESLKTMKDLRRRCGETQFRAAVQHLFDTGHQNFSDDNVNETKVEIQKNTKPNAIMTADFQCELLDCCLALSKLPIWDVLLYVKLYMSMDGDDTLLHEEAERAVHSYHTELGPQAWRDACADTELRGEIVQELVDRHTDCFSLEEIKAAVRTVVDNHREV